MYPQRPAKILFTFYAPFILIDHADGAAENQAGVAGAHGSVQIDIGGHVSRGIGGEGGFQSDGDAQRQPGVAGADHAVAVHFAQQIRGGRAASGLPLFR